MRSLTRKSISIKHKDLPAGSVVTHTDDAEDLTEPILTNNQPWGNIKMYGRDGGLLDLLWAKALFMGSVASASIRTGQVWRLSGIAHDCRLDTEELGS